ncbi:RagB/SusD family nutrient uptake outer membrane protein [Ferruginibacter sp. SUN002]|uniref:RagB/SusD family nutrient uptake outer membrane protein n=1 Tax=Ferruginibacter sp. SUN002 TaxID=2937789 RepID=UPI003D35DE94
MIKKLIFILALGSTVAACRKAPENGYEPVDQLNTYNAPTTLTDLESFLVPGYSNFRKSFNLYGFNLLTKHFASLEHAATLDYKDDRDWNELIIHNVTTPNPYVSSLWAGLYTGVKNVNVFLDRADFYESHYAKTTEFDAINQLRGEAYFLRAYYYFQLECLFGESYMTPSSGGDKRGVPIFKKIALNLEEASQPRSTVKEVWDFIIDDLKQAASKLAGVNRAGATKGRVSEWAAKGLLGKAYVFTGQYDLAKPVLKDVIDNSGKSLMSFSKYSNAFNALPESNEFNEESLFEINVERRTGGSGIFSSGTSPDDLTTSQGLIWGPMILGLDGYETGGGNIDMSRVNIFVNDKNLRRFGFTLPLFDTVQAPGFSGTSSRTNPQYIMKPSYRQQSLDVRADKSVDPRLYVCAQQPWVDSVNDKTGTFRVPVARAGGNIGNIYQQYGWSFKKYTTVDKSIYTYNSCDGANYYLLRLADVYLLYAEALKNTGDEPTALEYVNKVHRRAYGQPINSPSSFDYTSWTAATKASTADVNLRNNPLAYERFAEFFAEGQWWYDVCRWRFGQSEQEYYVKALSDGTAIAAWEDKMYTYPIPSTELSSNKKITAADQNPGY